MKVTILGCGGSAGVPVLGAASDEPGLAGRWGTCDPHEPKNRRTRASVLLEKPFTNPQTGVTAPFRLIIDTGPDFRQQLLAQNVPRIDAVLYTHCHSDHVAGLDELRAINRVLGHPVPVYGTAETFLELRQRFSYAFKPWEGGTFYRAALDVHEIPLEGPLTIGPFSGVTFDQIHGNISSLGVRFGGFAYSTDVADMPAPSLRALAGVDSWVVDCFQYESHFSHGWLGQVLAWRDLIKPRRTILTHMGHRMDYATLKRELPAGVEPAFDGMNFTVPDPALG
ncbi:MBL fold metallo-hydrolase [Formicincola oecophyllae]|uniref:MBL fold metallo-hydrolase n=1 Tax=Formicincola oecophyllae TaxID=2558361 RepID=A0A4Y6UCZ3_9PROT|nr:MBL fold metallo-hydrolase [Formicincola oecophyllae]QDH14251.1 MBL fold metallo-hydrolase [Formicincola oecophyllae]